MEKSCTNMDAYLKVNNNVNGHYNSTDVNTLTNYFLSSLNTDIEKHIKIVTHVLSFSRHNPRGKWYTTTYF